MTSRTTSATIFICFFLPLIDVCAVRALVAQYQRIAPDSANDQRAAAVDAGRFGLGIPQRAAILDLAAAALPRLDLHGLADIEILHGRFRMAGRPLPVAQRQR